MFSRQEYTKRPRATSVPNSAESVASQRYHPRHIVHPSNLSLQECLEFSDVIISAVPSQTFKVKTEWLKDGCVCLNVAAEKNFEKDVRDKVRACDLPKARLISSNQASIYIPAVGKVTILMLLRNLSVISLYFVFSTSIEKCPDFVCNCIKKRRLVNVER